MRRILAGSLFVLVVVDMAAAGEGRSAASLLSPVPAATLCRPVPMNPLFMDSSVTPTAMVRVSPATPGQVQVAQFAAPSSPTLAPPPPPPSRATPVSPSLARPRAREEGYNCGVVTAPPPIGGSLPSETACLGCCKPANFWVNGEYLLWRFKNSPVPVPLVTTGSTGIVGDPDTVIVLGGKDVDSGLHHGGRLTVGSWLDCDDKWGLEVSGFFFGSKSINETVASDSNGNPALFIPFDNVAVGEDSIFLSFPGLATGQASLSTSSKLFGGEVNGIYNAYCCKGCRWDLLAGFRFLQLDEELGFTASSSGNGFPGSADQFNTRNQFYGIQVGTRGEYCYCNWFINATAKVALGNMHQVADVSGAGQETHAGITQNFPLGFFALPTNIGKHSRNELAFVPEVTVSAGYTFMDHYRVFLGYNFLYLSNVLRPGDQIDRTLNLSQSPIYGIGTLVGDARPAVPFNDSSFWAQGVNIGLEIRW